MSHANSKNKDLRIGIVGAGPAGAMAATFLASKGYSVTLLERKKHVERKVCGEYLCPKGVQLLDELNLLDKLCPSFKELNGMILVSPTNIVVKSFFPQIHQMRKDRGLAINRKIFDQNILTLAQESGARLLSDKTVTAVSQKRDGSWRVNTLDFDNDQGEGEVFEFDFLIAADGRQSPIGHLLGHIKSIDTNRAAIHCYLPRKIDRGLRLGEMHILNDNQYCGLDPINDDEVNFSIVCDSELLKKENSLSIINKAITGSTRLRSMFDLVDESKKNEIRIVTTLKNKNNFIAGNNLAYVGDAAGFIDPLTGEGIYNAILSSYLLAESLNQSASLKNALVRYKRKKKLLSFQKNILNNFFQFLIKRPKLVNFTANYLKKSQERANQFIGIIGNIHTPLMGFFKMLKA